MTSTRETRLPTSAAIGGTSDRRKSLLPAPKSYSSKIKSPSGIRSLPVIKNSKSFAPGEKCCISGVKKGVIRYFGKVHFTEGEWCGIELNEPDGKHDGLVEGIRYFNCAAKHGLFAPATKVELLSTKLPCDLIEEPSSTTASGSVGVEKVAKDASSTNQRRTGALLKPPSSVESSASARARSRSRSPIHGNILAKPGKQRQLSGNIAIRNNTASANTTANKGASKLLKPKLTGKSKLLKAVPGNVPVVNVVGDSKVKTRHISHGNKPKFLKDKNDVQNSTFKVETGSTLNSTFVKDSVNTNNVGVPTKEINKLLLLAPVQTNQGLNSTYTSSIDNKQNILNTTTNVGDKSPLSNDEVIPHHVKLTPPSHFRKNSKKKLVLPVVQSPPVPDLVSQFLCHEPESLFDFAGEIMSDAEEEKDFLTTSNISHASSLGILTQTELCNDIENNLDTLYEKSPESRKWDIREVDKCNRWIAGGDLVDDKQLDFEIAGIRTPDLEVSPSHSSGEESDSSLNAEPNITHPVGQTTLEYTFQIDQGQTSTPTSPPFVNTNINETFGVKPKLASKLRKASCKSGIQSPLTCVDGVGVNKGNKVLNSTYVALKDGNANELKEGDDDSSPEEYPKRMKTSSEFDTKHNVLSASFELAKTAVTQYANLVKGAEQERALSLRKKDQRLSLIEIRSSSFDLYEDIRAETQLIRHSFHEDILRRSPSPFHSSQIDVNLLRSDKKTKESKCFLKKDSNKSVELQKGDSESHLVKNNIDGIPNFSACDIDCNQIEKLSPLKTQGDSYLISSSNDFGKHSGPNHNNNTQPIDNSNTNRELSLNLIDINNKQDVLAYDEEEITPTSELNTPGDYVDLINNKPEDKVTTAILDISSNKSTSNYNQNTVVVSSLLTGKQVESNIRECYNSGSNSSNLDRDDNPDLIKESSNSVLLTNASISKVSVKQKLLDSDIIADKDNTCSIDTKVVVNSQDSVNINYQCEKSSTDTGLSNTFSDKKQDKNIENRPVSLLSTTFSADTGINCEVSNSFNITTNAGGISSSKTVENSSILCSTTETLTGEEASGMDRDICTEESQVGGESNNTGDRFDGDEIASCGTTKERPTSIVSTTSSDTGYQETTESYTGSAIAASPTSVESPTLKDDNRSASFLHGCVDEEQNEDGEVHIVERIDFTENSSANEIESPNIDDAMDDEKMNSKSDADENKEVEYPQTGEVVTQPEIVERNLDLLMEKVDDDFANEMQGNSQENLQLDQLGSTFVQEPDKSEDHHGQYHHTEITSESIQNTITDKFILPTQNDKDIQENCVTDNENNQSPPGNFSENLKHNENIENENSKALHKKKEEGLAGGEGVQKVDEIDMLDMSWDNMEFTQIKEKAVQGGNDIIVENGVGLCDEFGDGEQLIIKDDVNSEGAGPENMDTDSQNTSVKDDGLSSSEAETSLSKSPKGPQKRKSKSTFVNVKGTKSSKLRSIRDSPEKEKVVNAKSTQMENGVKDGATSSKLPSGANSKLKRPSLVGVSPPKKGNVEPKNATTEKTKSAISKSQSRLSSQLRRPSNPVSLSGAKSPNPAAGSDSKSIQKRKPQDSTSGVNPVPNKKAAGGSRSGKFNTTVSTSTSKITDLNSSITSVGSKASADSSGEDVIPAPKSISNTKRMSMPNTKSRLATLSSNVGRFNSNKTDGSGIPPSRAGMKSRLSLPGRVGIAAKKASSDREDDPGISPRPAKSTNYKGVPSSSSTKNIATMGASSRLLVTSTPKSSQHSVGLPNGHALPPPVRITDLNVSDLSHNSSMVDGLCKSKPLTTKPPHRGTMNLKKRERSTSLGSEISITSTSTVSTLSNISRVSSQGSAALRPPPAGGRNVAGRSSIAGSVVDRGRNLSGTRIGLKKRSDSLEPVKKSGVPTATGVTGSKIGLQKGRTLTAGSASQPLLSSSPKKSTNQNRNKSGVAAPASRSSLTNTAGKRSQKPPDLVSNSTARDEISRLEALCENRTKELNYAKMQLKQSAAGFEAMSVLVKYLTEELDAFSLPEVNAQLKETCKRLKEAEVQLIELTQQRDALIEEIKCMKDEHQTSLSSLESDHSNQIKNIRGTLTAQKQQEIKQLNEKHNTDTKTLKASHDQQLEDLKLHHSSVVEDTRNEHLQTLTSIEESNESRLAELQKHHAGALGDITKRFEDIKMNLSEKVECLRGECDMLRKRENEYQESFQRDSDQKVEMALRPYQNLPQEIDSLKAVMEMRNEEIHALRQSKLEHERLLEEVPKAEERMKTLQQKNENLEAIINIRTDYERSLAEKHHVLLRKFDRESKANKRLSMENEEFVWRISQNEELSNLLNRSISHSPTSSTSSTPEPTRRHKSPLNSQSPRSPRTSGSDFEKYAQRSPRHSGVDCDKRGSTRSLKSNGDFNSPRSSGSDFDRIYSPRNGGSSDFSKFGGIGVNTSGGGAVSVDSPFNMSTSTQSEPSYSSCSTPVKNNLKRSGTYELLNEEAEKNGGHVSPTQPSSPTVSPTNPMSKHTDV